MRTTNDVAAVAEGLSVYDTTHAEGAEKLPAWIDVGGTSASTPIIAGVEALSSSAARSSGAAAFYASPSSLFDITTGADGSCGGSYLCTAGPGYDGPTGVGTPDGAFPSISLAPTVTSISPSSGPSTGGTTVTIKGTRFASPATVTIGSEAGEVDVVSADEIKAKTAATAIGADEVVVADANGTSSGGPSYTYVTPPPTVSGIEPTSGPAAGGTEVTITGTGFTSGATVHFGTKSASAVTLNSASQITATSPAGSGTVNVTVTAASGTSAETSADRFSYLPPGQTNGLDLGYYCQTLGYEGVTLARGAVTGPDYAYENWACEKSGGGLVLIASAGPAPSMENACQVENPGVAVYAYATEEDDAYTWGCYLVLPNVTSIEPSAGTTAGGTKVTIKGSGFLAGATVKIGSSATAVEVVSETEIKAKTAATAAGPQEVKVSDVNGGSSLGPTYTYATATEPTFAGALTHYEEPEAKFSEPNAVAVDPSGDIFIADSGHDRIVELNSERKFIRQFGEAGSGEGQFYGHRRDRHQLIRRPVRTLTSATPASRSSAPQANTCGASAGGTILAPGPAVEPRGDRDRLLGRRVGAERLRLPRRRAHRRVLIDRHPDHQIRLDRLNEGKIGISSFGLATLGREPVRRRIRQLRGCRSSRPRGHTSEASTRPARARANRDEPWGIATDPTSGNLYVSEYGEDRVQEFSAAGRLHHEPSAREGSGSGQLQSPRGMAVSSSGQILIADTATSASSSGRRANPPPTPQPSASYENPEASFSEPNAVAIDPSGDIFIADSGHDRIVELNSERKFIQAVRRSGLRRRPVLRGSAGSPPTHPGTCTSPTSATPASRSSAPQANTSEPSAQAAFPASGPLSNPGAIAIDSSGDVWVLNAYGSPEGGRIAEFSSTGTLITKFGSTGLNRRKARHLLLRPGYLRREPVRL